MSGGFTGAVIQATWSRGPDDRSHTGTPVNDVGAAGFSATEKFIKELWQVGPFILVADCLPKCHGSHMAVVCAVPLWLRMNMPGCGEDLGGRCFQLSPDQGSRAEIELLDDIFLVRHPPRDLARTVGNGGSTGFGMRKRDMLEVAASGLTI